MSLSHRVQNIAPSITLEITGKAKEMKAKGIDVLGFGAGEPDFDTPENIKQAAKKAIDEGFTKYTPAAGTPELRKAVAEEFKTDTTIDYDSSQIVVSCGAKHSLFNILQVILNEKDEVIIPSPYWLSYPEMVKMAGGVPVFVLCDESDGFQLKMKNLVKKITPRTKAIIINSPNNPTGCILGRKILKDIAEFAVENNIFVISDEIYNKIVYEGESESILKICPELKDLAIVVNGVSKSFSMTGWRIGYMAAPKPIASAISSYQSHSTSNPASIAQKAAYAALKGDREFVGGMVKSFRDRRDYMLGKLSEIPGVSCVRPGGAFYVFPNISKLGMKSADFAASLLEKAHVAVVPGVAFGWDTHIRLSYATSMEVIKKGLERIEKYIKSL
ncbi:MAG: pyridoxal phosphate-dependent aminotransferase [Candidatus Aureabacteria bacterium]|nr:pyridoxal phosphate-dependent aminotransferase [Candidatus Auribacterota bacterium]